MLKKFHIIFLIFLISCNNNEHTSIDITNEFKRKLVAAALDRTKQNIIYDGRYFDIDYPNGDIPSNLGVCTDVVIRVYREVGIDLQKLIHEDIKNNFKNYPIKNHWPSQNRADSNIDHRRVPNLEYFFSKHGKSLPITNDKKKYKPGDIITWSLMGSSPWHIGIVTNQISSVTHNPLIVHNIGSGPIIDDVLFDFPIRGHYRFPN